MANILNSSLDAMFKVRDILYTNIATANDPTSTTQKMSVSTQVADDKATGLQVSPSETYQNQALEIAIQGYQSQFGYDATISEKLKQLDPILGDVNSPSSFSSLFSRYGAALENFAAQPDNQSLRLKLVEIADELSAKFNDFQKKVQDLRGSCEKDIAAASKSLTEKLNIVVAKNQMVKESISQSSTNPVAANQRRGVLDEIAYAIPIRVTSNSDGSVNVFGPQGNLIPGNVVPIAFGEATGMNAAFEYPHNLQGLSVNNVDITPVLNKSNPSQLSALFELRDTILPNLSQSLDQLASQIKEEMNAIHNNASTYPGALNLKGSKEVAGTDAFYGNGSFRIATLNNQGLIHDVADINLAGLADVNAVIAAINGALNGNATASIQNGKLNIEGNNGFTLAINENTSQMLDPNIKVELMDSNGTSLGVHNFATNGGIATIVGNMNAAFGVTASAALDTGKIHISRLSGTQIKLNDYPQQEGVTIRSKGFSHYFGLNDFFHGETAPLSPSQSGSLKVNRAISLNPGLISSSFLSLTAAVNERGVTSLGVRDANGLTPSEKMRDALSQQFLFHGTGDMGAKVGSISDYTGAILTNVTSSISNANKSETSSKTTLGTSVREFSKLSKEDLSQSAQKIAELQISINMTASALAADQEVEKMILSRLAG